MPRLRNTATGVVVFVSTEKAARLGQEWQPAEKPAKATPRARTRTGPKLPSFPATEE
ncbi:DUF7302 family protein [Nocardia thailandica]